VPVGNAHSYAYGDTDRNSYSYANPHSDSNSDTNCYDYTNANSNANTDSSAPDTHSYGDAHSYGDSYSNANSKPIWECMPAANDGEPYSCSQHAVQFHGTSKRH